MLRPSWALNMLITRSALLFGEATWTWHCTSGPHKDKRLSGQGPSGPRHLEKSSNWGFSKMLDQIVQFGFGSSPVLGKLQVSTLKPASGAIAPAPRTLLKTVIMAWAPSLSRCAKSMHVVPTISSAFLFTLIVPSKSQGRLGTRKLSPQLHRTARFSHEILRVRFWDENLG